MSSEMDSGFESSDHSETEISESEEMTEIEELIESEELTDRDECEEGAENNESNEEDNQAQPGPSTSGSNYRSYTITVSEERIKGFIVCEQSSDDDFSRGYTLLVCETCGLVFPYPSQGPLPLPHH